MQIMSVQLGGQAKLAEKHEYGFASVNVEYSASKLLGKIAKDNNKSLDVWMSHGIEVTEVPDGFDIVASSSNCAISAIEDSANNLFGLQFHPEVTHTAKGKEILERFVDICNCRKDWTAKNIVKNTISNLKNTLGDKKVLLGLSGGVDSSVVAALLHKAVGDQLTCIFVDNGLLRLNEGDQVMETFSKNMGVKVIRANAQEKFYSALSEESDPEIKRKIIGRCFVEVFDDEAKKLKDINFLAQGTIYPDVIESAGSKTGKAKVIKSHHNVGGLPEDLNFKLVEPLRELFKDEVREIGVELGIPYEMLFRHPFPGPGLGVRILGHVKKEYADILRLADNIFMEELYKADLYHEVNQAFAVFLPVKSVGVTGDERRYDFVISLRAVETIDFMTARWARLPYDFLDKVSNRIINEINRVSRVVYDISGKPPATIEWE
jgi:GMP synthase (glutamine-hydrolysing)